MKDRLIKKFEDEIQALDHELKPELPKEIKRARELGDLRENAEYQAAKERQRLVESRISMLQKRVGEIALMNVDRIPHDRVGFGSTVHVIENERREAGLPAGDAGRRRRRQGPDLDRVADRPRASSTRNRRRRSRSSRPGGTREFEIVKLHDDPRRSSGMIERRRLHSVRRTRTHRNVAPRSS